MKLIKVVINIMTLHGPMTLPPRFDTIDHYNDHPHFIVNPYWNWHPWYRTDKTILPRDYTIREIDCDGGYDVGIEPKTFKLFDDEEITLDSNTLKEYFLETGLSNSNDPEPIYKLWITSDKDVLIERTWPAGHNAFDDIYRAGHESITWSGFELRKALNARE